MSDTNGRIPKLSPEDAMRKHAEALILDWHFAAQTQREGLIQPAGLKLQHFLEKNTFVSNDVWEQTQNELRELRQAAKAMREDLKQDADIDS